MVIMQRMKPLTLHSADKLLSEGFGRSGSFPNIKEHWFRAEDAKHFDTRLQPKLYRPAKAVLCNSSPCSQFTREVGPFGQFSD
jgi:hypothetical protein